MERRFPKSPLLHEEDQSGCSWGFRSVFELIFHKHSAKKLLSNTNRFNLNRSDNDTSRKKIDTFCAAKAKFSDDKVVSVKSNEPVSPPSSRTCWPSMLKDSDNTVDKDSRSILRGTFHHYLHLNDVRRSYGCKNIDVIDSEAVKNQKIATRQQSEQFLAVFNSNKELFLKLVETPDLNRHSSTKIKRFRGFQMRNKRIVLSWKRTRLRKNFLLKNSRIAALEPRNEIESFRSYFSFKRWIDKLKRPEHEKTSLSSVTDSKETNNCDLKSAKNRRKRNLGSQETPYRNCSADAQVHEVVPCTTSFHSEESIDNTNEHNEDSMESSLDSQEPYRNCLADAQVHEVVPCTTSFHSEESIDNTDEEHNEVSSESSLDSRDPCSLKTKETEDSDSIHLPWSLPPHELDPIHDYVKSVLTSAGLEWDELLISCQVSDQLLLPTLYQQIKFKSGGSYTDTDSLLLFDYVNEVLLEVSGNHTTKLGIFLAEEDVAREAMRCIDWDLVLQNRARTLEQVVKRDLGKFGSWLDDRIGEENIVVEVAGSILEDLIEEIYAD